MKQLIGLLLVIVGVALGLYVGIYLCFFRGIVTVIEQIRADVMVTSILAWGIVRIFLAGFFGWLSAFVMVIPGMVLMSD